jgi:glycosyltransferase involved in cell wall biosynthesis
MKVFYDSTCFRWDYGGVPKYFCEILRRLPKDSWLLPVIYSNNQYIKDYKLINCKPFLQNYNFRIKGILINALNHPVNIKGLLLSKYDIYHQTHYSNFGVKYVHKRIPIVTTIHDMNFLAISEYYPKVNYLLLGQKAVVKSAEKIIVVSNNTKKDIMKYWNIPEEKISVIYHGIDRKCPIENYNNIIIGYPYILFVGQRHAYKNFKNAALAFSILSKKYPDLKLVCTGPVCKKSEFEFLKSIEIFDKTIFFQASEDEMDSLYHYAEMMIFPSYYEGFGMPLLEAMIHQCPVICSDRSCFPEIAGNAALYFDPDNIDSIFDCMENVLMSGDTKIRLKHNGFERCKLFSWDKCAEQHLALYKSLL